MSDNKDWKSIVFDPEWLRHLDRMAAKRFGEGGLAEEASSYVIEALTNDNWVALSTYKGQSKRETYLHTLAANFLEEFSRKRFGRARPPEWLKSNGEFWVLVWKLVCLERHLVQTVVDKFSDVRESVYIKDIVRTIKSRLPWCGSSVKETPVAHFESEDEEHTDPVLTDSSTPDQVIAESRHAELLLILNCLLSPAGTLDARIEAIADECAAFSKKLNAIRHQLDLTNEERVILKMVYQDGVKKSVVAKALGMQEHLPGRILARVLQKIQSIMHNAGFSIDDVLLEPAA